MDIRKILDIVTEAEKPLAKGMKVMSLAQFLQQSGVEAPEGKEETVNELSPKTKKSYSAAAKLDKKYNDNNIDKAKRMSQEQPHKKAEWEDEIEFLKSVNAKRDRGLKRAGVAEGSEDSFKASHNDAVEQAKSEHGDPAKHEYKFDNMSGRHGAHNSYLHYPDKKVTVNTQMYKSGPAHNVFVSRGKQGVAEGAPELLKKEMPLVRHIDKILAGHGYKKGTPEYDEHFKQAMSYLRKFGNIDLINKQIDEAEKLGGVSARSLPKDELASYLDRIIGKSKEKTDKYKLPYIHSSNIPIVNDDGQKYDLQKLAAAFSERPTKILKQNEKMQHSDGTSSQFYNVGLPALKGLAIDEDTGEFVVIDTCPGAGACKLVCYAMKGGYVQWKASSLGQTKLLNFLYNDPDGFMGMLESEIAGYEAKNKKKNIKTIIRWHDAGDFFSPQYLAKAFDLAKKFPDVDFYAYTKLAGVAQGEKPDNFKINFSAGAQPSQEKKIDFQKTKNSRIVPKELFSDALEKDASGKWQYTSPQAEKAVKDRMAIKYSLDPKSVITYDEMMKIPVDKSPDAKGKWNVIVKPGDGDDAANRNDVLSSLLLIH
jgi:hypothetical protein